MSKPSIVDDKSSDAERKRQTEVEHHEDSATLTGDRRGSKATALAARAVLQNPLHGIPKGQLYAEVDDFCKRYGLDEFQDNFRRGALLAQRPHDWDDISELTQEDKASVAYEHAHKWSMSPQLLMTVVVCSLGAAVQGWDQTGSNGANLSFPAEFGIAATLGESGGGVAQWKQGLVNAIPYLTAPLIGCASSEWLNRWFGRRGAIFIAAIILIATPIGMAFTHSWQALMAVRAVFGIGIGIKGATIPVLAAEVSPTVIRGALVMGWQADHVSSCPPGGSASALPVWSTVGILLGFAANLIVLTFNAGAKTWRLQIASSFIPAVPLACLVFFCTESPRWYMRHDRMHDAYVAMRKLRKSDVQATRDLYYAWVQWQTEKAAIGDRSVIKRFGDLFTVPRIRRATLAAASVHIGQDFCGINTIAFYSSNIFAIGGATNVQALWASFGFGALNFVFTWPAVFTIDTYGRRALNLFFFPQMAWSLFVAGMGYLASTPKVRMGLVATFVYVYIIFYSIGEGPIPFMYSAELFPLAHRELGQAFGVSLNYFTNFILSLILPFQLYRLGGAGTFGFYTGTNIIAFTAAFLFVRETKQLSLEEIDQVFNVPTKVFIKYQVNEWIPWAFKHHILRNKEVKLAPLFEKDRDVEAEV